ncbi:MAG: hypothetical protein ACI9F2_000404, partial [Lysobacterales bacterium]
VATQIMMMKELLNFEANINAQDNEGNTALIEAVKRDLIDMVGFLVTEGANADIKNKEGKTAKSFAKNSEMINILNKNVTKEKDDATLGGIDFNDIDLDHEGSGVDIQFDDEAFQSLFKGDIQGFSPVIINFAPLSSVLPLLGLAPREEEYEVSAI